MEPLLIDTDIFIDIFRGDAVKKAEISNYHRYISAVSYIELIQGENTGRKDIRKIEGYLRGVRVVHITESISKRAVELVIQYGPSHHLQLADGLIAATAIEYDMLLTTSNRKDFHT